MSSDAPAVLCTYENPTATNATLPGRRVPGWCRCHLPTRVTPGPQGYRRPADPYHSGHETAVGSGAAVVRAIRRDGARVCHRARNDAVRRGALLRPRRATSCCEPRGSHYFAGPASCGRRATLSLRPCGWPCCRWRCTTSSVRCWTSPRLRRASSELPQSRAPSCGLPSAEHACLLLHDSLAPRQYADLSGVRRTREGSLARTPRRRTRA